MEPCSRLNRLERSLVKGKTEHDHLATIYFAQHCSHGIVHASTRSRNVEVESPEHDFRAGVVVKNPLDVLGHAAVTRDLICAQLHALDHYFRVLNDPFDFTSRDALSCVRAAKIA